jgi:hypothetical protein
MFDLLLASWYERMPIAHDSDDGKAWVREQGFQFTEAVTEERAFARIAVDAKKLHPSFRQRDRIEGARRL